MGIVVIIPILEERLRFIQVCEFSHNHTLGDRAGWKPEVALLHSLDFWVPIYIFFPIGKWCIYHLHLGSAAVVFWELQGGSKQFQLS